MPNHVRNDITILCGKKAADAVIDLVRSEHSVFDFNSIIPMPEPLRDVHSGGVTIDGKRHRVWREDDGKPVAIPDDELKKWQQQFGATDWYSWANKNWGTKWNAYDVSGPVVTTKGVKYSFDTAWESPEPVLQNLADALSCKIVVGVGGEVDKNYSYTIEPCD